MDLNSLLFGSIFLLLGLVMLVLFIKGFKPGERKFTLGNVQLISGATMAILAGLYFLVKSFM